MLPPLLRPGEEGVLLLLLELDELAAAAKSLKEFCFASSLKADSKVDGVTGTAELMVSFVGAYVVTSGI